MNIETDDDVVALKRVGKIVSSVLHEMLDAAEPGMTTRELDALGEQLLERRGARSAPKLTYVIYYAIPVDSEIYLLLMYPKSKKIR